MAVMDSTQVLAQRLGTQRSRLRPCRARPTPKRSRDEAVVELARRC